MRHFLAPTVAWLYSVNKCVCVFAICYVSVVFCLSVVCGCVRVVVCFCFKSVVCLWNILQHSSRRFFVLTRGDGTRTRDSVLVIMYD